MCECANPKCAFMCTPFDSIRYSMLVFGITLLLRIAYNAIHTDIAHTISPTQPQNYTGECVSIFNVMNTSSSSSSSMFCMKFIQNSKQTTLLFVDQNKLDGLCLELFKNTHTHTHASSLPFVYINRNTYRFISTTCSETDEKNHLTNKTKNRKKRAKRNKAKLNVCQCYMFVWGHGMAWYGISLISIEYTFSYEILWVAFQMVLRLNDSYSC